MRLIPNWQAMRERYNREFRALGEPEMTQELLAQAIGKSREEISRYETGARIAGILTVVRAAQVLICEVVGHVGSDAIYLLAQDCDRADTKEDAA